MVDSVPFLFLLGFLLLVVTAFFVVCGQRDRSQRQRDRAMQLLITYAGTCTSREQLMLDLDRIWDTE